MGAGFQGDIGGGAFHRFAPHLGVAQGHHFSVGSACLLGVAHPNVLPSRTDQHTADPRVGAGQR